MPSELEALPPARRELLQALKREGPATIQALARCLQVTVEAVRQLLLPLVRQGWVRRLPPRPPEPSDVERARGRPAATYALTGAAEELFPRAYADLLVALVDTVGATLGEPALLRTLGALTDARVKALEPHVRGLSLEKRLEAVRSIYAQGDPYLEVEQRSDGWRIIERNCPYLKAAERRPLLCSTTVSALARLLGRTVVREQRFQDGDGCCVFHVAADRPRAPGAPGFEREPDRSPAVPRSPA